MYKNVVNFKIGYVDLQIFALRIFDDLDKLSFEHLVFGINELVPLYIWPFRPLAF